MFEQLDEPERDVLFHLGIDGGRSESHTCREFLRVRPEEEELLRRCLEGLPQSRVLDIGCGVGRHSRFVRSIQETASHLTLVEIDDDLRGYTMGTLPGAASYKQLDDVPADAQFDLVLLLGNGLGIFGSEQGVRDGLWRIRSLLAQGGQVLIECGTYVPHHFHPTRLTIEYGDVIDGPFPWGFADVGWLEGRLLEGGFKINGTKSASLGGEYVIVHAELTNC
jgi:SAM-dependent methyltransferase